MKSKDILILQKILNYIYEIQDFVKDYTKEKFEKDRKTINACVFNLSQIGELVTKLSKSVLEENMQIEWRGLKGLRNRIVHDYDGVNLDMVWGFLNEELEILENQLKEITRKAE